MIMSYVRFDKNKMPSAEEALRGRTAPIATAQYHYVNGRPLKGKWAAPLRSVLLGMGCFWGAEQLFWQLSGVYVTAVGYSGGYTSNPTYEEVCSGMTGHTEVVLVVYNPKKITLEALLKKFWEGHNPTQYMRQGNDIGTNYRSAIYVHDEEDHQIALKSRNLYQQALKAQDFKAIVTEIALDQPFYYAEAYHQQYLAKNPDGYCGLQGTGIACPAGLNSPGR